MQSSLVYHRLVALRRRYPRIPLVVFVEDVAASGAFFIASAANEIVDPLLRGRERRGRRGGVGLHEGDEEAAAWSGV